MQTNNSSVKPLSLGHKPQLAGQLCPTRLTEVGDFRRLWNDNKEKSGMWSEVMGPWVCKAACKMLLEEFVASFGFLIPKQLLKIQALLSQRPSKIPVSQTGSPSCSSNITNLQPMIMRVPIYQFWDQLSDLQSKASSGTPSHFLTGKGGGKKAACELFGKWIQLWIFCRIYKLYAGAHDSENLGSKGMGRATCK